MKINVSRHLLFASAVCVIQQIRTCGATSEKLYFPSKNTAKKHSATTDHFSYRISFVLKQPFDKHSTFNANPSYVDASPLTQKLQQRTKTDTVPAQQHEPAGSSPYGAVVGRTVALEIGDACRSKQQQLICFYNVVEINAASIFTALF